MTKRTLFILAALVAPLVVLGLIALSAPDEPEPGNAGAEAAKTGASALPRRLPSTGGKASTDGKIPPPLPPHMGPMTLEQARERLRKQQERLEQMTPEMWEEEQRQRMERRMMPSQNPPPEEMPED